MYVEGNPSVDRGAIARHVESCADCSALVRELEQIIALLSDPEVHGRSVVMAEERDDQLEALLRRVDDETSESAAAKRMLQQIEVELNRNAAYALSLTDVVERMGSELADANERRFTLGDAWKHRCNALRHLGRYDDALRAAETAEAFYSSLSAGHFDVAQAQLARAGTLFKMTRFAEVLDVLAVANATLREFGDSVPLAKAIMLEASILIDRGDVEEARRQWRTVLPMLERLGASVERARVLANLAECNLRLGNLDDAMNDATLAIERYTELGMDAEATRSRWTIGMVHLARGESAEGLRVLRESAVDFESREMAADAGFVKLDVCEELLRRGEWDEAAEIARALVLLFTEARVTLASVTALESLRRAVENREATPDFVRSVRESVTADDPEGALRVVD